MRRMRSGSWLLSGLLVLLAPHALAVTIDVSGADGADGVAGAPGNPGGDGQPGGIGGPADANATSADLSNSATATGGSGGVGGHGGAASPANRVAGDGGAGGAGGNATATATTTTNSNSETATATATGGAGGAGGDGGSSSVLANRGQGGNGGDGGDATASASTDIAGLPFTFLQGTLTVTATGGDGGAGGFASVPSGGDPHPANGGAGGNAHAGASASGTTNILGSIHATARGGNGGAGWIGGDGGGAQLDSISGAFTNGSLTLFGLAIGGNGGDSPSDGTDPLARNGNGANVLLDNVVSSPAFSPLIYQEARGGDAGQGYTARAGVGGNATSLVSGEFANGAATNLTAVGGRGSPGQGPVAGSAGDGGDATVGANLTSAQGALHLGMTATGGDAGGLGDGGDAAQTSFAQTSAFRDVTIDSTVRGGSASRQGACAGDGVLCRGGNATSQSSGVALSTGFVTVTDNIFGGEGGSADPSASVRHDGGPGGGAVADVSAVSHGFGRASASTYVRGGRGGNGAGPGSVGGAPGAADGHAHAESDTGDVSASVAIVGGGGGAGEAGGTRGADVFLVNRPTAQSLGRISLSQSAGGGISMGGTGARGGDARSELTLERFEGAGLSLSASALGGQAGIPFAAIDGGRGGDAVVVVEGIDHTGGPVDVSGSVSGGSAFGPGGQVGTGTLQSVIGRSTAGGTVHVSGGAGGGSGRNAGSADLLDAVEGDTSGALTLSQTTFGGWGDVASGHASSVLHKSTSSTSLEVDTAATGGRDLGVESFPGANPGADAYGHAESEAINDLGSARALATGTGGSSPSGDAGDGFARASATSTNGAAHATSAAIGGSGGWISGNPSGSNGHAGDALSESSSDALGDSIAESTANGGGAASDGEDASGAVSASAVALSRGLGHVEAHAQSFGSTTIVGLSTYAHGPSHATADGTGRYTLDTSASFFGSAGSSAQSTAHSDRTLVGVGASVTAGASVALASGRAIARFRTPVSRSDAEALTGPFSGNAGPVAFVEAAPFSGTASWVTGNPTVQAALGGTTRAVAVGLVRSQQGGQVQYDNRDWTSLFSLDVDRATLLSNDLAIGFLDPSVPDGLDFLSIEITLDGAPLTQFEFTDAVAARAALDDRLVDIALPDAPVTDPAALAMRFVFHSSAFTGEFLSDFVLIANTTIAPEPQLLGLVGLAAALAICRARGPLRRRTNST